MTTTNPTPFTANWAEILKAAVTTPGMLNAAYKAFHSYSLGNQLLAMTQLALKGLAVGPIATFPAWKAKGRFVRKGEKALFLCMPVTFRPKAAEGAEAQDEERAMITTFTFKPNWFALSQTDGPELPEIVVPPATWDQAQALQALEVTKVAFDHADGNVQGYAEGRKVAVNPVAGLPAKTLFHELAHVVLGHTAELMADSGERTPKDIREVEAESVALLLCETLELPGPESSRAYIQNWLSGNAIADKTAQRIFGAADKILRAGQPVAAAA